MLSVIEETPIIALTGSAASLPSFSSFPRSLQAGAGVPLFSTYPHVSPVRFSLQLSIFTQEEHLSELEAYITRQRQFDFFLFFADHFPECSPFSSSFPSPCSLTYFTLTVFKASLLVPFALWRRLPPILYFHGCSLHDEENL